MQAISSGLPLNHPDRERMEERCCVYALGDLPEQEWREFAEHLASCDACKQQIRDYERLMVFDLSPETATRLEQSLPAGQIFTDERALFNQILARAREMSSRTEPRSAESQKLLAIPPRSGLHAGNRIWKAITPWVGWAVAASAFILLYQRQTNSHPGEPSAVQMTSPISAAVSSKLSTLEQQLTGVQKKASTDAEELKLARQEKQRTQVALDSANSEIAALKLQEASLQAESEVQRADLNSRAADLAAVHAQLHDLSETKEQLQVQLAQTDALLIKQKAERTHLEEVAASTAPRRAKSETDLTGDDAREILGARDLHIVDVYDVDNGGRSAKVYGRVYYVNHSELIFYAFDLSKAQKNRKAVAFQAWGYRQPHSTTAESLGLFYMDNVNLNRWALRVSDPQLLSRIDTLFVTLEPPGGSPQPRGQRLLIASLAGPANHP